MQELGRRDLFFRVEFKRELGCIEVESHGAWSVWSVFRF